MRRWFKGNRWAWLLVGLLAGLSVGGVACMLAAGYWPQTPLHAVATDRYQSFAIATGPVDGEVEALYFLDFLTGDLRAVVLGYNSGKFQAFYQYNILKDFGIQPGGAAPQFLMVTGVADISRGGARVRPSRSVVYIAEINSGIAAAYAIPWDRNAASTNQLIQSSLVPVDITRFRTAVIRPSGVGVPAMEAPAAGGAAEPAPAPEAGGTGTRPQR